MSAGAASPEAPVYRKISHLDGAYGRQYMIICDEGWRTSVVCSQMYEWAADWMLGILGRRPYAPGHPGG